MLSGYYTLVDPHTFIEDPQNSGFEIGQFNFDDWKSIRAEFLVKGSVKVAGGKVQLTARLFDVYQQRAIMGKTFNGDPSEVPRMARRFADAVLKAVTGIQGPFDSKLAFVSTRGGRFKEIYTQTIDGEDLFQVTNNPTINLFPMWDRNVGPAPLPVVQDNGARALHRESARAARNPHRYAPRPHHRRRHHARWASDCRGN